jgi:hypothetical protein
MTRKDYILIAAAIKAVNRSHDSSVVNGIRWTAERIADVLARDNPRFDRERFLTAAGVQS